jgi:hypothetical protein
VTAKIAPVNVVPWRVKFGNHAIFVWSLSPYL